MGPFRPTFRRIFAGRSDVWAKVVCLEKTKRLPKTASGGVFRPPQEGRGGLRALHPRKPLKRLDRNFPQTDQSPWLGSSLKRYQTWRGTRPGEVPDLERYRPSLCFRGQIYSTAFSDSAMGIRRSLMRMKRFEMRAKSIVQAKERRKLHQAICRSKTILSTWIWPMI